MKVFLVLQQVSRYGLGMGFGYEEGHDQLDRGSWFLMVIRGKALLIEFSVRVEGGPGEPE